MLEFIIGLIIGIIATRRFYVNYFNNKFFFTFKCSECKKINRLSKEKVRTTLNLFEHEYGIALSCGNCNMVTKFEFDEVKEWFNE